MILKLFLAVALYIGADFLISALIVKGICWAFSLAFSWKMAFGVWLALLLLHGIFRSNEKGK